MKRIEVALTNLLSRFCAVLLIACAAFIAAVDCRAQVRTYPKEIRGYKVERAAVEIKKPESKNQSDSETSRTATQNRSNDNVRTGEQARSDSGPERLINLGKPQLARVTPLGVTFEVPVVVAPVKQSGRVDFLLFENMVVNGASVEIDEYHRAFDLPKREPLTLPEPLRIYLYLPSAVLTAIDDWSNSKTTWLVTGSVYVCGKFKKSIFSFKRCVPVEVNATIPNPLSMQSHS